MRIGFPLFRLTLGLLVCAAPVAVAQPVVHRPRDAAPDPPTQDPPDRIGRIGRVVGAATLQGADRAGWKRAETNQPIVAGTVLRTGVGATADLDFGPHRIALAADTDLSIQTLGGGGLVATLTRGEIYVRLGPIDRELWMIATPLGRVALAGPGRYRLAAGEARSVAVVDGEATIDGQRRIGRGAQATWVTGEEVLAPNAFLLAHLRADAAPAVALPGHVAGLPGGEELARTGEWVDAPGYGPVWHPPVAAGWAPYRNGHWATVPPWGSTWIDDAPWGFAPSHYGRWAEIGGRWGWVPGYAQTPYAPALVTFLGVAAGAAAAGWVPLGPREPYRPWFHTSERYRQAVNPNTFVREPANGRFTAPYARPSPQPTWQDRSRPTVVVPRSAPPLATHPPGAPLPRTIGPAPLHRDRRER